MIYVPNAYCIPNEFAGSCMQCLRMEARFGTNNHFYSHLEIEYVNLRGFRGMVQKGGRQKLISKKCRVVKKNVLDFFPETQFPGSIKITTKFWWQNMCL